MPATDASEALQSSTLFWSGSTIVHQNFLVSRDVLRSSAVQLESVTSNRTKSKSVRSLLLKPIALSPYSYCILLMNDNPKRERLTTTRVDGHRVERAGKSSQTIWRIVKEESKMLQSELDPQCERNN
jgi:hypothetical protein